MLPFSLPERMFPPSRNNSKAHRSGSLLNTKACQARSHDPCGRISRTSSFPFGKAVPSLCVVTVTRPDAYVSESHTSPTTQAGKTMRYLAQWVFVAILSVACFMSAKAQGLEEQATLAYADAHEALAQAREAWAFARDKQENAAFFTDLAATALGVESNVSEQMLVEIDAIREEADRFREIARSYQVRASDLIYSPAEAEEHAAHSQEQAAEARKNKLYAEDWVKETRRKSHKEYRQKAVDAEEKAAQLFDTAHQLFAQLANESVVMAERYESAAQAQETLADAEERWAMAEEAVAAAEEMWTRALEGDKSAQAKTRSTEARERAKAARERTIQWRERAAKAREGSLEWDEELGNELRERAAQARQEMYAGIGNAAVIEDNDNSRISRVAAELWQRAASAWENAAMAMEGAADAWDWAIEAQ